VNTACRDGHHLGQTAHLDRGRPVGVRSVTQLARLTSFFPHAAFLSPQFVKTIAQVHREVYVCVIERDGVPTGFLPFQFPGARQKMLGAGVPAGSDLSNCFGLSAPPDLVLDDPRTLLRLAGIRHLAYSHLDESQAALGLTGEEPRPNFITRLRPGYWDDLRRRDKKLFDDTLRQIRQVEGSVGQLRFCFRTADWEKPLAELIAAKREQYRRTFRGDALAASWKRQTLALLAGPTDHGCRGVLSTLHAGSTWLASHYGFESHGLLHCCYPV
jgi:CelD/BcsL family acetyltransferase involved in cellulose biosynthesis